MLKTTRLKTHLTTHDLLIADDWNLPYTRQQAFFPLEWVWHDKYWPPVSRIDNVFGDRNIVCSCPPLSDWVDDFDETDDSDES